MATQDRNYDQNFKTNQSDKASATPWDSGKQSQNASNRNMLNESEQNSRQNKQSGQTDQPQRSSGIGQPSKNSY